MKYFILLVSFFVSQVANAGLYAYEGKVADVLLRTNSDFYAVFYVAGFHEAGSCRTFRDHVIIGIPKDDLAEERFSMLMALHMADKNVHVLVDDLKQSNDSCEIQDLRLDKSF